MYNVQCHVGKTWCVWHLNMSEKCVFVWLHCGDENLLTHQLYGDFSRSPQGKPPPVFWLMLGLGSGVNIVPLTSMLVDFLAGLPTLLDAMQLYAPPSSTVTAGMVSVPPLTTLLFGSSSPPGLSHLRVGGGSPPEATHTRVMVSPRFTTRGSSRRSLMEGGAGGEEGEERREEERKGCKGRWEEEKYFILNNFSTSLLFCPWWFRVYIYV